jgi:O-antigen/teichoic acid export membrane protein
MRSRVLWRRSATALGVYTATALGFLMTVVATRRLGVDAYAQLAAVLAATGLFQVLFDLTIEEALVKYGFRYAETQQHGRLRRLFEVALAFKLAGGALATIALIAIAPFAAQIWNTHDVLVPMLVSAAIPLVQAPEAVGATAITLRGRYDVRGALMALSMALRLVGIAIGCRWGVTGAVVSLLVTQILSTGAICVVGFMAFRRFPNVESEPIGDDRRALRGFLVSSTISSSLFSVRAQLATALLPAVAPITQAAYFRNAQAPATGFSALSAPARLVLMTEQTRDFEAGRHDRMYGMLRRYIAGTSLLMLVSVPVLWVLMPWLMGVFYGQAFRDHAANAARLVLLAAALQLVWGWTKTFPVSIGRPNLRIWAQSVEIIVFVPLLLLFASLWGATGAAAAMLVSTAFFCALWALILFRMRNSRVRGEALAT